MYCAMDVIRDNTVKPSAGHRGDTVKIVVAAPPGWGTDALCGMLREVAPTASIEQTASAGSLVSLAPLPQLALIDVDPVTADAPRRIAALLRKQPSVRIVAFGSKCEQRYTDSLLAAGALAYMPRSFPQDIVKGTLRLVVDSLVSDMKQDLPPAPGKQGGSSQAEAATEFGLTRRQAEVLALVCEGKSNLSIGQHLGIKEGTVKQHLLPIFDKMKVRDRKEAMLVGTRSSMVAFRQIKRAEGGKLDLDWLLGHMSYQRLPRDTLLFRLGDPADELYYLQRGTIRLKEIAADLTDGTMFGEIGIFAPNRKRTCSAVCTSQVDLFKLTAEQVKRLYMLNPQFGLYIVHTIATRLMADRSRKA
jgi:DNA-binding NarL/FixJ family response regulator